MGIELYQRAVLTQDIETEGLKEGDVVTVIEKLAPTKESGNKPGFAIEAFNALGETKAVAFVPESAIRPLSSDEILHIRKLALAV
ncbi:MAG: DUF4926 domain-containing protein [Candidatus Aureabacteria bacterium]|nr:DUF4926 domain-containing protein [Candidatus Auribacterota bacterium]